MKGLIFLLLIVACQNPKQVEPQIEFAKPEQKEKYFFVGILMNEPVNYKTVYAQGTEQSEVEWQNNFYTTDINSTSENITEDIKYMWFDEAERGMRKKNTISLIHKIPIKIISRELFTFDSYKDASIALQKISNGEYTENTNVNTLKVTHKIN